MKSFTFKVTPLFIAVQSAMLMSVTAYAETDSASFSTPTVELATITIDAEAGGYNELESSSATGMQLTTLETPQSTTVITEELIEDSNTQTVAEVFENTSGLNTYQQDGGRTHYYARGFEIDNYQVDGMNVYHDNVWTTNDNTSSTSIIEKVEVVKGANALMTGSGNPSASVNIIRKQADRSDFSGEVSIDTNNHKGYGAMIDLGTGLNESGTVRGRIIADYTGGDTFVDLEERDNKLVYGVIDADVTDNTTISIGAKYSDATSNASMWGGFPAYNRDGTKTDFKSNQTTATDWGYYQAEEKEYFASVNHDFNDNVSAELKASHTDIETDSKLFYVTNDNPDPRLGAVGNQGYDRDTGTMFGALAARYKTEHKLDSVQGQVTGNFDAFNQNHQFAVGASYAKDELGKSDAFSDRASIGRFLFVSALAPIGDFNNWKGDFPEPKWYDEPVQNYGTKKTEETGIFASTKLQMTDKLSVLLGSRLSNYESSISGSDVYNDTKIEDNNVWTPYVGVTYEVVDNLSVYGSYTDIFKPQKQRDINGDYLDSIKGNSYEVGVKATTPDERLQGQLGVFYIQQDNLAQETDKYVPGLLLPERAYKEAEGATSIGVDAEVSGYLTDNWKAMIGYSHYDAEDKDGNIINPHLADTSIKAFTSYDMSNYINGLTLGAGVNYMNERYKVMNLPVTATPAGQSEKYKLDSVTVVDVMANYKVNENFDLQLNVDNVFDKEYVKDINSFGEVVNAAPLTVTGKISYKW